MRPVHSSGRGADLRSLQLSVCGLLRSACGHHEAGQEPGQRDVGGDHQAGTGAQQGGDFGAYVRRRCGHYTYNARRLMEHGPLSWAEFLAITGWPESTARRTWGWLQERQEIVPVNVAGERKYQLKGRYAGK